MDVVPRRCLFHKNRHSLCPHGFAELIYAAGFLEAISCLKKCLQIAGKAGCLTGNIYNPIYSIRKDFWQCLRMDSVTRRIQNDHIRFLGQIIEEILW